ncbi:MAG: cobalamin-binding protein [Pyrinomonadaceae bacterium]|nr:cobalamin-binding protein [Pyrinomonadaceae bacterium]
MKNLLKIIIFSLILFCFIGCKTNQINTLPNTRQITDDLGRKVTLPNQVTKVVSLAPNLTEIVFAVDSGEKLVGVTEFCNFPEDAKKIQKIGDTMKPNLENIIALKPDVVLVSTASQLETFTQTLEKQGIAVFISNPNNLDSIYKTIYQVGEIFGKNEKTNEVVNALKKRVSEVEAKTQNAKTVKTFVQISREPLFTIGKDSFLTDLVNRAGGTSVTADISTAYPNISKETALTYQPEAIILSDSPDNQNPNEVFLDSSAVKTNKVFKINADILSRPSPRVVDALEQIAKALHPKEFE